MTLSNQYRVKGNLYEGKPVLSPEEVERLNNVGREGYVPQSSQEGPLSRDFDRVIGRDFIPLDIPKTL